MARLTVEDCILRVPNRFDLVLLASRRSRNISAGAELTVERDNDKNAVVALREIAEGTVDVDELRHELIRGFQSGPEIDEPSEEEMNLLAAEQAWADVTEGEAARAGVHFKEKEAAVADAAAEESKASEGAGTAADSEGDAAPKEVSEGVVAEESKASEGAGTAADSEGDAAPEEASEGVVAEESKASEGTGTAADSESEAAPEEA